MPNDYEKPGMLVLAGNSHPELSDLIAERLGIRMCEAAVFKKPNKETTVEIKQSVRDRQVFIIQTGTKDVNNDIMELLIMIYACKTAAARQITVVMPYMPYTKQCRMRKRSSIVAKLLCDMIARAGADKIITMDLYRKEIQGFFGVPVDNLRASPFLLQYIREKIPDYRNAVIVAKNPGVMNKATSYAERLRIGVAVIHGVQKESESDLIDGRSSPPPFGVPGSIGISRPGSVASEQVPHIQGASALLLDGPGPSIVQQNRPQINPHPISQNPNPEPLTPQPSGQPSYRRQDTISGLEYFPSWAAKEKPPLTVVGDVSGHIAIMVDEMVDDVSSFVAAAEALKERGAYKIYVMATHGLLSADAPQLLESSPIDEVVVTNTVPHELQKMQCHKIKTVDVSIMLSEAIRRTFHNESMSYLFRDVTVDD